jgi:hypothetical protein
MMSALDYGLLNFLLQQTGFDPLPVFPAGDDEVRCAVHL